MVYEQIYTDKFFSDNTTDSTPVAEYLAPIIVDRLNVKTVVDLGCATGHWLRSFLNAGCEVVGIEGSANALTNLVVPEKHVFHGDLRQELQVELLQPVDLVFSLEVAEHIEPNYADTFVKNLTQVFKPKHIIMTAAPVGQGGEGHFNEQPNSYWYQKIEANGYVYDPPLKDFLVKKVIEGREWNEAPEHLKANAKQLEKADRTIRGYDGVWIPSWLPANLMCFKPDPELVSDNLPTHGDSHDIYREHKKTK